MALRVALVLVLLATPALADGYRFADVALESVYDGDSLRVSLPGVHPLWGDRAPVRVDGIDAPEIRGVCEEEKEAAVSARDRLRDLLGASDRIDLEQCEQEKYGRLLCLVIADGRDVGEVLVAEGHAREYDGGTREPWCE